MRSIIRNVAVALAFTVLTIQPAFSQEVPKVGDRHERAVRELIRSNITPEYLESLYFESARQAAVQFQATIQPTLGRSLTENEQQRLHNFWYRKLQEMMPYEALEQMLVPLYMRSFSLEEVEEINRFYATPVGSKLIRMLPTLTHEAGNAGLTLANNFVSNQAWMNSTMEELRTEFPSWFPK